MMLVLCLFGIFVFLQTQLSVTHISLMDFQSVASKSIENMYQLVVCLASCCMMSSKLIGLILLAADRQDLLSAHSSCPILFQRVISLYSYVPQFHTASTVHCLNAAIHPSTGTRGTHRP